MRRTSDVQKASFDSRSTSALRSTSIVATARVPPACARLIQGSSCSYTADEKARRTRARAYSVAAPMPSSLWKRARCLASASMSCAPVTSRAAAFDAVAAACSRIISISSCGCDQRSLDHAACAFRRRRRLRRRRGRPAGAAAGAASAAAASTSDGGRMGDGAGAAARRRSGGAGGGALWRESGGDGGGPGGGDGGGGASDLATDLTTLAGSGVRACSEARSAAAPPMAPSGAQRPGSDGGGSAAAEKSPSRRSTAPRPSKRTATWTGPRIPPSRRLYAWRRVPLRSTVAVSRSGSYRNRKTSPTRESGKSVGPSKWPSYAQRIEPSRWKPRAAPDGCSAPPRIAAPRSVASAVARPIAM